MNKKNKRIVMEVFKRLGLIKEEIKKINADAKALNERLKKIEQQISESAILLDGVLDKESESLDNLAEHFSETERFYAMEENVDLLTECIEELNSVLSNLALIIE